MSLTLLSSLSVSRPGGGTTTVQLCQGDLSNMAAADQVNILVVSALPNDYSPAPGSLIGALAAQGVSVQQLSQNKAHSYEPVLPVWISQPITSPPPGIEFNQVLVYEPSNPSTTSAQTVGDIFQAIQAYMGTNPVTVALPLVSTGSGGADPSQILRELFYTAVHGSSCNFPFAAIKLVIYDPGQVGALLPQFQSYAYNYQNLPALSGWPGNYSGFAGPAWQWAQANAGNFPNMLTRQLFAVRMYTSNYYATINTALRANNLNDPNYMAIEALIEAIDSGLTNIVSSPGLTYRGLMSMWNPFTPGSNVLELAYVSTSRPAGPQYQYAPYKMNLNGQTGKPVYPLSEYPTENEYLYGRMLNELVDSNQGNLITVTEQVTPLP